MAIQKYGPDKFIVEKIDDGISVEDLNEKERYWIRQLDSMNRDIGYNLTPGGGGGDTYKCKSKEELNQIKKKISIANSGKKNGMSKQIKCMSILSNTEIHFDTLTECLNFFNLKNKGVIIDRAKNKVNTLFHKEWLVAFECNVYKNYDMPSDSTRGTRVKLEDLFTGKSTIFNSRNKLYLYLGITNRLNFKDNICYYKNYKLELLN